MDDDKNVRNTKQRKQLLELLRSTTSHPNAFWLYDRMKPDFPNLSLSTVYRNLGILERQGQLLRLPCISFDRYDANTSVHTHFYCRQCESVYDLETGGMEKSIIDCFDNSAHTLEGCNIMFYGICEKCNSKN